MNWRIFRSTPGFRTCVGQVSGVYVWNELVYLQVALGASAHFIYVKKFSQYYKNGYIYSNNSYKNGKNEYNTAMLTD